MELLFELLFEFFVDGSVEALGNKKVPKPLRFVALIFLIVVLGGISALCIFSGIVEKNWILINSIKGAEASAIAYSIAESAKANELRPYMYFKHLLTVIPEHMDQDGNIDPSVIETLLPWSASLPEECHKRR